MEPRGGAEPPHDKKTFPRPPWQAAPPCLPGRNTEWYRWTGVAGMLYASKVFGLSRVTVRGRTEEARDRAMGVADDAWTFRRQAA